MKHDELIKAIAQLQLAGDVSREVDGSVFLMSNGREK